MRDLREVRDVREEWRSFRHMSVIRFEDLECWQLAKELAVELYAISNRGEFGKDFGLKDQIRRAAVSIASNIAEGKERETLGEFVRHLYIAKGSAGELKTQLLIAQDIGYLDQTHAKELKFKVEKISAMLGALIKTLKNEL
jgi:four helix bundle protein